MDAATGELKLAAALDHETTARYHLIVEARSGPAAATPVPVTITVTPAVQQAARAGVEGEIAFDRLGAGSPKDSGRAHHERLPLRQARRTTGRRAGQRRRPYEEGAAARWWRAVLRAVLGGCQLVGSWWRNQVR